MKLGTRPNALFSGARPVAPAGPVRRRRGREGEGPRFRSGTVPPGATPGEGFDLSSLQSGSASATLAGIVAQNVFHTRFGSRPEESIAHAVRA